MAARNGEALHWLSLHRPHSVLGDPSYTPCFGTTANSRQVLEKKKLKKMLVLLLMRKGELKSG